MKKFFLGITGPLVVIILTPFATSISSKLKTDSWTEYLFDIHWSLWLTFLIILAAWMVLIYLYKRRNRIIADSMPQVFVISNPTYGWERIGQFAFKQVLWNVRVPNEPIRYLDRRELLPSDLDVQTPALCPKCKTELEEKMNLIGSYTWHCVGCGFKKRNKDNFHAESERVLKLAKRKLEEERE